LDGTVRQSIAYPISSTLSNTPGHVDYGYAIPMCNLMCFPYWITNWPIRPQMVRCTLPPAQTSQGTLHSLVHLACLSTLSTEWENWG